MVLNCIILGSDPEGFEELENFLAAIPYVYLAARSNNMEAAKYWLETQTIHVLITGHYHDPLSAPPDEAGVLPVMMMVYNDTPPGFDFLPVAVMQLPFTPTTLQDVFSKIYKIIEMHAITYPTKYDTEYFMLRTPHRMEKVFYEDLQYVEVMDDHIMLHLRDQKLVTTEKLDWIISQLPLNAFMHVHHWFVIGFRHITHLADDHVMIGEARIALTKAMRTELAKRYQLPMY
ncbi:LytR/AlgR family response regulator transcription factor [Chitinophaga arvensicola]|uniref:LytTr DNA-binding domain-containing protein n=1 Tax=Chitinophaga arvensicola TaxID=29529 RepID=A0A1I0SDJ1_9BACT|nr:LytTR family transcriptional regulator DNA-binding domain-containing protein [Chitinophaga arvensicola]SEW56173.1 LytTr DNA-binding domain-containing protein [Chitinophaga arvensicola]